MIAETIILCIITHLLSLYPFSPAHVEATFDAQGNLGANVWMIACAA